MRTHIYSRLTSRVHMLLDSYLHLILRLVFLHLLQGCMRKRSLVRGRFSRVASITLLDLGVSEGTFLISTRWLLGAFCGDGPGVGVPKTSRYLTGLGCSACRFSTSGARLRIGPGEDTSYSSSSSVCRRFGSTFPRILGLGSNSAVLNNFSLFTKPISDPLSTKNFRLFPSLTCSSRVT